MNEKKKRDFLTRPQERDLNFLRQFLQQVRLSWALMRDNRVPFSLKLIPLAAIAYVISPIDLIPDVIPILGQLDDLGIVLAALSMFNSLAPAGVVAEHLDTIRGRTDVITKSDGIVIDVPDQSDLQLPDVDPQDLPLATNIDEQHLEPEHNKKAPGI